MKGSYDEDSSETVEALKITYPNLATSAWVARTTRSCPSKSNEKTPLQSFLSFPLLTTASPVSHYPTSDLPPDDVRGPTHTMTLLKKDGHSSRLFYKQELLP